MAENVTQQSRGYILRDWKNKCRISGPTTDLLYLSLWDYHQMIQEHGEVWEANYTSTWSSDSSSLAEQPDPRRNTASYGPTDYNGAEKVLPLSVAGVNKPTALLVPQKTSLQVWIVHNIW